MKTTTITVLSRPCTYTVLGQDRMSRRLIDIAPKLSTGSGVVPALLSEDTLRANGFRARAVEAGGALFFIAGEGPGLEAPLPGFDCVEIGAKPGECAVVLIRDEGGKPCVWVPSLGHLSHPGAPALTDGLLSMAYENMDEVLDGTSKSDDYNMACDWLQRTPAGGVCKIVIAVTGARPCWSGHERKLLRQGRALLAAVAVSQVGMAFSMSAAR